MSPTPPRTPRDSQEALARSIARAVQEELPAPDSEEAIRESVEEALRTEACRNELVLAIARSVLIGLAALLGIAAYLTPSAVGIDSAVGTYVPLAAGAALVLALGLAYLLHRGWYRPWLRRWLPLVDGAGIASGFYLLQLSVPRPTGPTPLGTYAAAAVACSLLAFSGSLRLSKSASRTAIGAALFAWATIWFYGDVPVLATVFIAALIAATGILATRFTRIIRHVITEEVARLRLVRLYRQAEEAIDAREEVLRIVSHDLRNPLSTIAMATDLLLRTSEDPAHVRYLGILKRQGERMKHMVNDLLDVARIEAGRLPIDRVAIEVTDVLEPVMEMMGPLAQDQHLELVWEPSGDLPRIDVDPERINQVFSNLIGNAIKFTPEGGRITLRAGRAGDRVRMSVADTGPGIPPHQLGEVFGRLWQARRDDGRGIGLGLTIARAIVEAHGEQIGVESRLGEGTEFWFTVPIVP